MKLFVALCPPAWVLDDVFAEVARLRVGQAAVDGVNVRLVDPTTAHITLAFLGDVDDDRLPEVTTALGQAVVGPALDPTRSVVGPVPDPTRSVAGPAPGPSDPVPPGVHDPQVTRPLRLRLAGGGQFGEGRYSVLWADVHGDVDGLCALAGRIRSELHQAGLPYDPRPYRPHLTIARPQGRLDPADLAQDRAALDRYRGPDWPVTEVVLFRSHLGPRPLYHRLAGWPL